MNADAIPFRNHKDSVFRMLFSEKESAIELFNALEGTDYGPDTEVEFTTLEDAVYAGLKNDLGFIIAEHFIVLTEHQSTINNNMPLRQLEYIGRTFEKLIDGAKLYAAKDLRIPTPEFFVIYTGNEKWGATSLRLSDSFLGKASENSVELVVKIINVRYNEEEDEVSRKVLERSEKLRGYSLLLEYIRENRSQSRELKEAIDGAIQRCLREGVLKDFLEKNSPEVGSMLFKEITSEEFAEIRAREAAEEYYKKGHEDGIEQGIEQGLERGLEQGIANLIAAYREFDLPDNQLLKKLIEKYPMEEVDALTYLEKYR